VKLTLHTNHPPRTIPCASCNRPVPRLIAHEYDGRVLCRLCHAASSGVEHRTCIVCLHEKPLDTSHFYRKVRGTGFMRMCRRCRDARLRRRGQRICGGCWHIHGLDGFSLEQWSKSFQHLALCINCDTAGRGKHVPRMDERVCPRCNVSKSPKDFYQGQNRISPYCKMCTVEYNKERYHRIRRSACPDDIDYTPRTIKMLYALETQLGEQAFVDSIAAGCIPEVDDTVSLPTEAMSKGDSVTVKRFMDGFELALRGKSNIRGVPSGNQGEAEAPDSRPKRVTIRVPIKVKRRNHSPET